MPDHCTSCGKADANLKACEACKLVKYCGVECQVAHRPAHKKACTEKAKELFDEKLYAQPPMKDECPICMIPLPCHEDECTYMSCCGKIICIGCRYCLPHEYCPFCNTAAPHSHEESIKRLSERIENYDPHAMVVLSSFHRNGWHGLPVDQSKAIELLQRACELGSAAGHCHLGSTYRLGNGAEIDMKKAVHNFQIAAMMGNMSARKLLGCIELENGNLQHGMKHLMIAANSGLKVALDVIKQGFKRGLVTKEEFEKTLRGYQDALEETKSEQRDRAAAIIQAGQSE
eukprot:scaffold133629_cov23-Cyclotella_meneghiniana.AAC.1